MLWVTPEYILGVRKNDIWGSIDVHSRFVWGDTVMNILYYPRFEVERTVFTPRGSAVRSRYHPPIASFPYL